MIQNNPQDVSTAFETLLKEVEAEVDFVNTVGSRSFDGRVYSRDREALIRICVLVPRRNHFRGHSLATIFGASA